MPTRNHGKSAAVAEASKTYEGLTRAQLVEIYRLMYTSRRLDDREILLKRQQKIFFQISGAGHEAVLAAVGLAMKPAYDWFFPYYRDRALCLALGATPYEMLLQAVGAADDPSSGGRQMPSHWGYKRLNVVTQSSCTGTQVLHAVGCAEVSRHLIAHPNAVAKVSGDYREFKDVKFYGDEVTYTSVGDGTTSEGEFWEAMNAASNLRLPLIFLVEDNGYAISVPVEVNTAGGNISRLVSNFPNFHFEEIDGTDPVVSYAAFSHDGHTLASGTMDGKIQLWDVGDQSAIGVPLTGHTNAITSLNFSPDGTKLLSASDDHTLRLWPAPPRSPDAARDTLCAKLTHNMSREQWKSWVSGEVDYIEACPGLPEADYAG